MHPRHRPARARRLLGGLLAAAVAASLTLLTGPVQAADRDDLVRRQDENSTERERLRSALEGVTADLAETYLKLDQTKRELPVAQAQLAEAEEKLSAAERTQEQVAGRLELAEAEVASLEEQLATGAEDIKSTRTAMGELARSTYRGDNAVSTLTVVLDAGSTEDFLDSYAVMGSAVRSQTQVLDDLETAAAVARNQQERQAAVTVRIGELKTEADAAVVAADEARDTAAAKKTEIEQIQSDMEVLSARLEDQKDQHTGQIAQLEADNADLAREIAAIDEANRRAEEERRRQEAERRAAEDRARQNSSRSQARPAPAAPAPVASGQLRRPVPSVYVTSPYGYRVYPITGGWFMHNGVDLRSACGDPQHASAAGTVVAVRSAYGNGTHGNQVMINHGVIGGSSYVTVYNHLSGFAVSQGQQVSQGQVIGRTGATGNVTGCHVHFEVWKNGSTIDPMRVPGF